MLKRRFERLRYAAVGAVCAVVVGGAGIMGVSATVSSGERATFVPIAPCRLMDTRWTEPVGLRSWPLGPGDIYAIPVRGSYGNCTITPEAVALSLNVTAVDASASSYLTVYPSDATRPLASNLNWTAGQPAVPNAVTTDISADGRISFYNNTGYVDVVVDVVGYFVDHNHDDRYFTKEQVDALLAAKANRPVGPSVLRIDPTAFNPIVNGVNFSQNGGDGSLSTSAGSACFSAPVLLPDGVTVTGMKARVYDNGGADAVVALYLNPPGSALTYKMAEGYTQFTPGHVTLANAAPVGTPLIDARNNTYFAAACIAASVYLYDVQIEYTAP